MEDMMAWLSPIIVALITYCIPKILDIRKEKQKEKRDKEEAAKNGGTQLDRIEKDIRSLNRKVDNLQVDEVRTNLMLLLSSFRDSTDIAKLSKQYVKDYSGDSYIIPLIVEWYDEKKLAYPEWLKKAYDEHCNHKLDNEE